MSTEMLLNKLFIIFILGIAFGYVVHKLFGLEKYNAICFSSLMSLMSYVVYTYAILFKAGI